jgi:sortase (surface protein transpeptidase)
MREEPAEMVGQALWVARRLAFYLSAPGAMLVAFLIGLLIVGAQPVPRAVTSPLGPKLEAIGVPLRLEIPSLHAIAPIVPIEVRNDVLTPPANVRTVGWWRGSAQPYSPTGQTLMTGHAAHAGYSPMNHLHDIRPGASITIRSKDQVATYLVQKVFVWNKKQVAQHAGELFQPDTPDRRLVLVTSAGYDGRIWHANVIVFALPV